MNWQRKTSRKYRGRIGAGEGKNRLGRSRWGGKELEMRKREGNVYLKRKRKRRVGCGLVDQNLFIHGYGEYSCELTEREAERTWSKV